MAKIWLKGLSKSFGNRIILKKQDMCFLPGRIYGIVGYNGCGKTVLLKCISGLMLPSAGRVDIQLDENQTPSKPLCGIVIDGAGFNEATSGVQNLTMLANVSGKADKNSIQRLMTQVGLNPHDRKKVQQYSLGMRQRLAFAQAIMEDPPVLLLDEPLNGLDYEGIKTIYKLLDEQKKRNKVILVASHHEEDIRLLCDEVYWLKDGLLKRVDDVSTYALSKKELIQNDE